MDEILISMSEIINNNFWIAPFISFLAGVFTSITPCSLSSIPLIIGCIGGIDTKDSKKAFKISLVFAIRNVNYIYSSRCWSGYFRKTNDFWK